MASRYTSLRKGIKPKNWSWRSLCLDTWIPEITATLFSIACFIAICSILIAYNQESRPMIYPGLSLNAIISVLATGCKSSLIFVVGEAMGQLKRAWFSAKPKTLVDIQTLDSASRGPLGSIATLFQRTRRSLASIGAVVIILLLAFDPFIQQIISYPTRLTDMHGGGSVATTKRLDYFVPAIDYNFIYSSGLWSEDTMLRPSCSSGNCTWSRFRSAGMCNRCFDITKSVDLKCEEFEVYPNKISDQPDRRAMNFTCHLTPPQGNSAQFYQGFLFLLESSESSSSVYQTSSVSWHVFSAYGANVYVDYSHNGNYSFNWPGDPLMVVAYAEIEYDEDYLGPDSDLIGGMKVDKVTQCSLELCVLEHDVSVEDGTPEINTSVLDYGQLLWRNSPAHSTPTGETLCWQPTSGPQDITFGDYIRNDNSTYAQLGSVEYAFCGISYDIKLHESVFVGSMIRLHFRYPKGDGNQDAKPDGDPNTIRIGSVGLDTIMSNVAKQMNKEALRLNGSDVHGITHVTEVYVEVQWLWLILPIVLVVTGIIFVVMVIIDNKKNGTSLWKSSVLAFLYHGLHDVDKEGCMAVSVMERKAEELVVRLQASDDGNGGLILREQKDSV